ncbi:RNA chaperone Hfq [Bacillus cereus]|nr:RNA chaperone Hfq [Bacillus cereus]
MTLFLKRGIRILEQIVEGDRLTVLMIVNVKQQLIYNQTLSTINK